MTSMLAAAALVVSALGAPAAPSPVPGARHPAAVAAAAIAAAPTPVPAPALAPRPEPPAGRPPRGPLERYEPRRYEVRFEVTVSAAVPYGQDDPRNVRTIGPRDGKGRPVRNPMFPNRPTQPTNFGAEFDLVDTPIVMPLIYQGAYSRLEPETIRPGLWLANRLEAAAVEGFRIDDGAPHHTHLAVLPVARFRGQDLRWRLEFRLRSYASRIDDQAATRIPWPREWPKEVADGLTPQFLIESDDPLFKEIIERRTQGRLRMVAPYLVAKDLVRFCITELQVTGDDLDRGRMGVLHGMRVYGARRAAADGLGNKNDLVCVCVALLRAAGIPARPVIGMEEDQRGRTELVTWAEFYLPEAGWVPFDPGAMRTKGILNRDINLPWPEFGTMKDLNRRIPLAYHFIPPRAVESPQNVAVWGWDPRPRGAPEAEQRLNLNIMSLGRVQDDEAE